MSKEKHRPSIIYALADYKQLVLSYKSKYSELIKRVAFWKTTALWLLLCSSCVVLFFLFELSSLSSNVAENKKYIAGLSQKIELLSQELVVAQKDLLTTKEELHKKEDLIKQLEQNISNASKKLLEKLLKEQ
jgi:Tfp pilus assembly protein PilN